jgi:hypothetical protein
VAFVESFEAEQNTQITSAEEGRERIYFERGERLIQTDALSVDVYPYPFAHLEFCRHAKILVTNEGKDLSTGPGGTFRPVPELRQASSRVAERKARAAMGPRPCDPVLRAGFLVHPRV